jgi:glycosyltransferase involved in cell wall biosynthesis
MKLSLCIATYNESKNLHYALDSTIDWVDEVVIVDGGSTDSTVELAKSYGPKVKVINTDNPPIFHINKQKAIEAAKGDWILQLDADEEVTLDLKEEIQKILNSKFEILTNETEPRIELQNNNINQETPIAYQIPRKNYFLGRFLMKGGVYPDYTIRLYRRGAMYFPCKDVHENVKQIRNSKFETLTDWLGTMKNPMNHYSDPTFARYWHRWKRYCAIEAGRVQERALRLYGNTYRYTLWKIGFVGKCILILPIYWFFLSYFRHKGFMDGWQGLVFHFMSAMRWWGIAVAVWRLQSE